MRGLAGLSELRGLCRTCGQSLSPIEPLWLPFDAQTFLLPFSRGLAARVNNTESKEHLAARLAHQSALKDLRRQWAKEHRRRVGARQQQAQAQQERLRQRRAAAELEKQAQREQRVSVGAGQQDKIRAIQAEKAEQGRKWREAVGAIYESYNQKRKLELLEQSSNWIRPEELENRIEEALSNPVELYENVSKDAYTTKTV